MTGIAFSIAVLLLLCGHYFRMMRWKQFIEIYEKPRRSELLRALSLGYVINFFIPYRLGDLLRAIISGRKFKNGFSFSLATIMLDYCLDVPVVGTIFFVFAFSNGSQSAWNSVLWYGCLLLIFLAVGSLAILFKGIVKKVLSTVSGIFNPHIEFNLMFFFWSGINAVKDCFLKVNKRYLIVRSAVMWVCYLLSYAAIARCATQIGTDMNFEKMFSLLFASGVFNTTFSAAQSTDETTSVLLALYLLAALLLLFCISFLPNRFKRKVLSIGKSNNLDANQPFLNLLPQINEKDRLSFLEQYFSNEKRDYLNQYIELNRDVRILQDFSAGSNATTMLCMDELHTFYRKYAFGEDGDKLYEQVEWLQKFDKVLCLPQILKVQRGEGYCSYDMDYNSAAVGLFNYIHSSSLQSSWNVVKNALEDISASLHTQNVASQNSETLNRYITNKVWNNVEIIESAKELKLILGYETLVINGVEYKNLSLLKKWLDKEYLAKVFSNDIYADIHGDLTVENIICWDDGRTPPYYFIDPNTGNVHESPALDYAKLLQSFHGGYEFLMRTEKISVVNNQINFLFACSKSYNDIFAKYKQYLEDKFNKEQVRSIFFHEVVHWLRLMPYKINKNGKRSLVFYAGLIMVFNDVVKWYGEND